MADLDTREWLLTNGLGSFAVRLDACTRTYHGWLIAALDPPSWHALAFAPGCQLGSGRARCSWERISGVVARLSRQAQAAA